MAVAAMMSWSSQCRVKAASKACNAAARRLPGCNSRRAATSRRMLLSCPRSNSIRLGQRLEPADAKKQLPKQRWVTVRSASDTQGPSEAQDQQRSGSSSSSTAVNPVTFLVASTLGNGVMALAGIALGDWQGLNVSGQLLHASLNLPAALACMLPLMGVCYYGVKSADEDAGFGEIKRVFEESLIPQLQALPGWGLCLLALGAGVGEETLFRGFLQAAAAGGMQDVAGLAPAAAAAASVAAVSLLFGALHAVNPTYFFFATLASAVLGVEYNLFGLQAAAATHFLYDWAALAFVLSEWGSQAGGSSEGGSSTPPA